MEKAKLITKHGDKLRVLDVSEEALQPEEKSDRLKKLGASVAVKKDSDSCFVMQPFAPPLGEYYDKIFKPAIEKAGLLPLRADAEIFGTGKIMDQVWRGIKEAKILVAELTTRNPNVFYELGLAHALRKPVVLVSSNESDVPFDLHHIRVIYYDVTDPFWGAKLIEKVAENILSFLKNSEEAIFKSSDEREVISPNNGHLPDALLASRAGDANVRQTERSERGGSRLPVLDAPVAPDCRRRKGALRFRTLVDAWERSSS